MSPGWLLEPAGNDGPRGMVTGTQVPTELGLRVAPAGALILDPMGETRDERRKKAKAEERRRQEEIDERLKEPRPPAFEAPASAHIVENPPRPKRPS